MAAINHHEWARNTEETLSKLRDPLKRENRFYQEMKSLHDRSKLHQITKDSHPYLFEHLKLYSPEGLNIHPLATECLLSEIESEHTTDILNQLNPQNPAEKAAHELILRLRSMAYDSVRR